MTKDLNAEQAKALIRVLKEAALSDKEIARALEEQDRYESQMRKRFVGNRLSLPQRPLIDDRVWAEKVQPVLRRNMITNEQLDSGGVVRFIGGGDAIGAAVQLEDLYRKAKVESSSQVGR